MVCLPTHVTSPLEPLPETEHLHVDTRIIRDIASSLSTSLYLYSTYMMCILPNSLFIFLRKKTYLLFPVLGKLLKVLKFDKYSTGRLKNYLS